MGHSLQRDRGICFCTSRMVNAGTRTPTGSLHLERDVHTRARRFHWRLVAERSAALARLDGRAADGGGHRHGAVARSGDVALRVLEVHHGQTQVSPDLGFLRQIAQHIGGVISHHHRQVLILVHTATQLA